MTGIAEMFAEYSTIDSFAFQFALERCGAILRDRDRDNYRQIMADPVRRERHRARKRKYWRDYERRRRASDPAFVEMRRKSGRESEQRRRASA